MSSPVRYSVLSVSPPLVRQQVAARGRRGSVDRGFLPFLPRFLLNAPPGNAGTEALGGSIRHRLTDVAISSASNRYPTSMSSVWASDVRGLVGLSELAGSSRPSQPTVVGLASDLERLHTSTAAEASSLTSRYSPGGWLTMQLVER